MTREEVIERFAKKRDNAIHFPDGCEVISLYDSIELINRIYDDFENKNCKNCKYWNNDCMNISTNTTGFCTFWGISNGDFEEDMKNNFCCNKLESK